MIYPKNTTTIKIDDFSKGISVSSQNDLSVAKITYNFDFLSKELKTGLGVEGLKINYSGSLTKTYQFDSNVKNVENCWFYKVFNTLQQKYYGYFVVYAQKTDLSHAFYVAPVETSSSMFYEDSRLSFSEMPIGINLYVSGENYVLFVPKNQTDNLTLFSSNSCISYQNSIASNDACYSAGKVFLIPKENPHRLFVTTNTTEDDIIDLSFLGEYVDFSDNLGDFLKLVSLNGCVYAFRQYGLTKITPSQKLEDFYYKNYSIDNIKIYENTICVCEDRICMLTSKGVYIYDGAQFYNANLGFEKLLKEVNNKDAIACYHNGFYYVSLNLNDEKNLIDCSLLKNNSLLKIDLFERKFSILRGISVSKMLGFDYLNQQKLVVCFDDSNSNKLAQISNNGKVFSASTKKVWNSFEISFSEKLKQKVLKSITLFSQNNITIKIWVDGKSFVFNISPNKPKTKINTNLKGTKFEFCFVCEDESVEINEILFEVCWWKKII